MILSILESVICVLSLYYLSFPSVTPNLFADYYSDYLNSLILMLSILLSNYSLIITTSIDVSISKYKYVYVLSKDIQL